MCDGAMPRPSSIQVASVPPSRQPVQIPLRSSLAGIGRDVAVLAQVCAQSDVPVEEARDREVRDQRVEVRAAALALEPLQRLTGEPALEAQADEALHEPSGVEALVVGERHRRDLRRG